MYRVHPLTVLSELLLVSLGKLRTHMALHLCHRRAERSTRLSLKFGRRWVVAVTLVFQLQRRDFLIEMMF